ncbi:MAG: hypothetical protein SGILL_004093, partial [Bacillariaceae sp.]
QRLDALEQTWKQQDENGKAKEKQNKEPASATATAKKKKRSATKKTINSDAQAIQKQSDLSVQSCLTNRQPSHIQAIPLAFGLKRVLVEDWEILNAANRNEDDSSSKKIANESMVHVLPTKIPIRNVLTLYLKEKGIEWSCIAKKRNTPKQQQSNEEQGPSPAAAAEDENGPISSTQPSRSDDSSPMKPESSVNQMPKREEKDVDAIDVSEPKPRPTASKQVSEPNPHKLAPSIPASDNIDAASTPDVVASEDDQLTKEWTDMANGICVYFEQALTSRLLYPSEVSQLIALEDSQESEGSCLDKIDIYGCEHLLRLISILPRTLDQQHRDIRSKRRERTKDGAEKQDDNDDDDDDKEDGFAQTGSLILAKLQDLARFLQKNQSTLFCSRYRKKNDTELALERKIQKRQERRLKNRAAMLAQHEGAMVGTDAVAT